MQSYEIEKLLTDLRNGVIRPSDIRGEQFQAIIFHKLIERCLGEDGFEYDLMDNYKGAVDFVVREKARRISQFHADDPIHVFECKYYRRKLELSNVAKLLVFGVRFQPTSLNVVSKTSLQPQVYEYARVLFNGLGNDAAMFRRTLFRHYKTSDLLDLRIDADETKNTTSDQGIDEEQNALDLSWEITECRPFVERIIAESGKSIGVLILNGRWSYRLKILANVVDPKRVNVWVDGLPGNIKIYSQSPTVTAIGEGRHNVRIVRIIDPRALEKPVEGQLALHIEYGSRTHRVLTLPLFAAPHNGVGTSYPDLRDQEVDKLTNQMRGRVAPRLLLLGGEAGVGKTYLCEKLAERIQVSGEFDVNRFSLSSDSGASLLNAMLITICTPAAARSDNRDEWRELAASLLETLSPVARKAGRRSKRAPEVIIPVLAELLVRAGPRLIVLRDAHLLNERTAQEIRTLVARLDDLGWGEVYCIIEHRTPDGKHNPHWLNLEAKLRARVSESLQRRIEPLTATEIDNYLDSLFVHITPELKKAIWDRCGGIPLFLISTLELLNSEGSTRHVSKDKCEIVAPTTFLASKRTGRRADGVIEDRLKAISWRGTILPKRFQEAPIVFVAMLAVAQGSDRVEKLCRFARISPNARRSVRRTLMHHNIIRQSGDEWNCEFQHDLLRCVAIELGKDIVLAQPLVEQIIEKVQKIKHTVYDLELCADLAAWLGLREDANQALNAAFERLRKSDNFALIQRILVKLCNGLEPEAFNTAKNYGEYLSCRSALAWTTWNTGSLVEAREQYSRLVADALSGTNKIIDSTTAEAYAADAQRRILGINLGLEDIPSFVDSARRALSLNGHSVVFNSVMNRLILYCARLSHVDFGLELTRLNLQVFGDPEPESSGAVLCSDVAALFRATAPQIALMLYERGEQFVTDDRQRLYNELNILITRTLLDKQDIHPKEIATLRRRLEQNGLRSMLSRFDLFCAALDLRAGRVTQARNLYQHIETAIAVYRHEYLLLGTWNDKMIAGLVDGDYDDAHLVTEQIIARMNFVLKERRLAIKKLHSLKPAIEAQLRRFSHLKALDLEITTAQPSYSGVIVHILLNLEMLSGVVGGHLEKTVRRATKLWPKDLDHSAALDAFFKQPSLSVVQFRGASLVLCAQ